MRARITLFFSFLTFNTTEEKILYLTPEQEKDKSHFTDKEVNLSSFCKDNIQKHECWSPRSDSKGGVALIRAGCGVHL